MDFSSDASQSKLIPGGPLAVHCGFSASALKARTSPPCTWMRSFPIVRSWGAEVDTRTGLMVRPSTLKKQHKRAIEISKVRPFVLYTCRHTFLTRLGASGCDAWTLAKIAGHSSIALSARYVHPSEDSVLSALEAKGGHKIGHGDLHDVSELLAQMPTNGELSKS